jgi:hypothetical protein
MISIMKDDAQTLIAYSREHQRGVPAAATVAGALGNVA